MGDKKKEIPEEIRQKFADAHQILQHLHSIAVEQESELDALRAKNMELQQAIEEKQKAYDHLAEEEKEEREKLRKSLDAMEETLKKNQKNLDAREESLEKREEKLASDREKYEADCREFEGAKAEFERQQKKFGDLKAERDAYEKQRNTYFNNYNDMKTQYTAEKERADQLQSNLEAAQRDAKRDNDTLIRERDVARNEVRDWKAKWENMHAPASDSRLPQDAAPTAGSTAGENQNSDWD